MLRWLGHTSFGPVHARWACNERGRAVIRWPGGCQMGMFQIGGVCTVRMSGGCVDEAGWAFLRPVTSHAGNVCVANGR